MISPAQILHINTLFPKTEIKLDFDAKMDEINNEFCGRRVTTAESAQYMSELFEVIMNEFLSDNLVLTPF